MHPQLKAHIKRFVNIADADLEQIGTFFTPIQAKKKHLLLKEGDICKHNYFVVKGLLRMYYVKEKGTEQTTQFALETWWLADYMSLQTGKPANFNIQTVEVSEILALSAQAMEDMLVQYPQMERYFRIVHQRAHAAAQRRQMLISEMTGEEMYRDFARNFPDFVQRIPQYLLASYLNMTPEYLSEIRAKRKS